MGCISPTGRLAYKPALHCVFGTGSRFFAFTPPSIEPGTADN